MCMLRRPPVILGSSVSACGPALFLPWRTRRRELSRLLHAGGWSLAAPRLASPRCSIGGGEGECSACRSVGGRPERESRLQRVNFSCSCWSVAGAQSFRGNSLSTAGPPHPSWFPGPLPLVRVAETIRDPRAWNSGHHRGSGPCGWRSHSENRYLGGEDWLGRSFCCSYSPKSAGHCGVSSPHPRVIWLCPPRRSEPGWRRRWRRRLSMVNRRRVCRWHSSAARLLRLWWRRQWRLQLDRSGRRAPVLARW
ncbi:uncharacterized protein LOC129036461 isoform X1 [Pongo pygmaeus]|uniref:uncharacterized protein LOC129036461 isoform X1 n=1 Tax=Pongo pygmaeus TaxID=9600 RepID=UPI0023E1A023|nr:uncharacterized protein LOC129036461 isoform X1 [Pongo pygmaeus]